MINLFSKQLVSESLLIGRGILKSSRKNRERLYESRGSSTAFPAIREFREEQGAPPCLLNCPRQPQDEKREFSFLDSL